MFPSFSHRSSSAGDGLVRIRNLSIALLGLVTAIGLGLIVFVSQQGWPGVISGPLPAGPGPGVVHNDPIALTQPAEAPTGAPGGNGGTAVPAAPSSGAGGVKAGSTGGTSPQPVASAPVQAVEPSPSVVATPPPAAPQPPATAQPPASSPTTTPTSPPVSTPVSTPTIEESSKPVSSGTSKSPGGSGEKSKSEVPIIPPAEWDKSKDYGKDYDYGDGGEGLAPEQPKSSSYTESDETPDSYLPPLPVWEGWAGKDAVADYSGEYEESDKDDD